MNGTVEENISPDYLIPILSHIAGQTIIKEKTLIVFDEVQLCERALTSLKYFCEDASDYHIIAAGSLLGVAVNRARFSFPVGKVDVKTLYPQEHRQRPNRIGSGLALVYAGTVVEERSFSEEPLFYSYQNLYF